MAACLWCIPHIPSLLPDPTGPVSWIWSGVGLLTTPAPRLRAMRVDMRGGGTEAVQRLSGVFCKALQGLAMWGMSC